MKNIHYLVIIFFSASLMFPGIGYDPIIDYYRLKQHYSWLTPTIYYPIYEETKGRTNVSMDDVCAIIQSESGDYCHNNPDCMIAVRSSAGAIGLLQVMRIHTSEDLTVPAINIKHGVRYYAWCLQYAKGNKREALRFYNAGPFSNRERYKNWWYVNAIVKNSSITPNLYNKYYEVK